MGDLVGLVVGLVVEVGGIVLLLLLLERLLLL